MIDLIVKQVDTEVTEEEAQVANTLSCFSKELLDLMKKYPNVEIDKVRKNVICLFCDGYHLVLNSDGEYFG